MKPGEFCEISSDVTACGSVRSPGRLRSPPVLTHTTCEKVSVFSWVLLVVLELVIGNEGADFLPTFRFKLVRDKLMRNVCVFFFCAAVCPQRDVSKSIDRDDLKSP